MSKRPFNLTSRVEGNQPAELIMDLLRHGGMPNFREWLKTFDFKSKEDIVDAVKLTAVIVTNDRHMNIKANRDNNPNKKYIFNQFDSLMSRAGALEKFAYLVGGELWGGYFSRYMLDTKTEKRFSITPNKEEYESTVSEIKDIWGFNDKEIEKFRFFVCMVKDSKFPPSLRRLLYIWGDRKQTGKTTLAGIIISILNGEDDVSKIDKYSSSLAVEMQAKSFAVPRISECNAVLMDEMFYSDMSRTYNSFKAFITSENGTARLPYGQAFQWFGKPNYIGTSNFPLKNFIKDDSDRRYLEIKVTDNPKQISNEEIFRIWKSFCINAEMPEEYNVNDNMASNWKLWNDAILEETEIKGESHFIKKDYSLTLKDNDFRDYLRIKQIKNQGKRKTHNHNRVTVGQVLKFLSDELGVNVSKDRSAVEDTMIQVFGPQYKESNYWLLDDMAYILDKENEGEMEESELGTELGMNLNSISKSEVKLDVSNLG